MAKVRAHVFISGKVQGVFFRQTTKERAESLDVSGWVRNLPDGRVEAVFEGEEPAVKTVVEYCYHGPSRAKVTDVEVSWEEYVGEFRNFDAR
jgi:acylphosphatase